MVGGFYTALYFFIFTDLYHIRSTLQWGGGNGSITWCSDVNVKNTTASYTVIARGYSYGVKGVYMQATNYSTNNYSYRPVLEPID